MERSQTILWRGHERTDETAECDNCGRDFGPTKPGPNDVVAQPERVSGMIGCEMVMEALRAIQPPYAENGISAGVGGVTGAIP